MSAVSNVESKSTVLPEVGVPHAEVLARMEDMRGSDLDWRRGRTWSLVYSAGEAHHAFLKQAHNLFFSENALNPMAFNSLRRMESEVVRMSAGLFNGGPESVGTMTSGGTESLLLAVKAARDRARKRRPWVRSPEIVVPKSIHVGFDKACHYFGLRPRYVPLGPDFRVDVRALKRRINRNTVLIAASAPQYCQGVIDPIEEIGAIAQAHDLPFHVDSCIGGFVLPWIERLGRPLPVWDFRVPGVTSISADIHKYGFGAKGASVIIYRDMSYLEHQFFISTDWPGGIYASPSVAGTRPGGPIAAAWAAMQALGASGYMDLTRRLLENTDRIRAGIEAIDGLRVLGNPHSTLINYASVDPKVDIYAVSDQLEAKGWDATRQQDPDSIHLTVSPHHDQAIDDYLRDLAAAVDAVRANPELKRSGNAAMYGLMAKVPFRGVVRDGVMGVMRVLYGPNADDPELDAIGDGANEGLLMRLANKYGAQAMEYVEQVEPLQKALKVLGRRR